MPPIMARCRDGFSTARDYNTTFYTVDPAEYGCEGQIYLRVANCYPTGGWGGAVSSISIFHSVEDTAQERVLYGDVNQSGKV